MKLEPTTDIIDNAIATKMPNTKSLLISSDSGRYVHTRVKDLVFLLNIFFCITDGMQGRSIKWN